MAEMVERANRRLEEGAGLDDEQVAKLKASFTYLMREHGREDAAERMAREAVARADRSGDAEVRWATAACWRGSCSAKGSVRKPYDWRAKPTALRADWASAWRRRRRWNICRRGRR